MSPGVLWYYGTIVLAGIWLAGTRAGKYLTIPEIVAMSVPLAAVGGAWLVFIAGMLWSSFTVPVIIAATVFMAWMAWRNRKGAFLRIKGSLPSTRSTSWLWGSPAAKDGWIALAVVLAISTFMWPIYSDRMIPPGKEEGVLMTAGSCYGDLPIHIAMANSFLVGVNQEINWPARRSDGSLGMTSVIYAGEPLTYPFLPDFHAAILVRMGDTMRNGFLHPGFTLICSLWALIYFFSVRVARSRLGGVFAVIMTLGAGGMAGVRWWLKDGWSAVATHDVIQHDHEGEWMQLWFAFVPHVMLPQRGANFAYPMAMAALILLWIATDHSSAWAKPVWPEGPAQRQATTTTATNGTTGNKAANQDEEAPLDAMSISDRRRLLILTAVITSTLPMHQAHAFIGVGIIVGIMFLFDIHKWSKDLRLLIAWGEAGIVALALSLPQMNLFTKTAKEGFGGKFTEQGWLFNNYEFGKPHNSVYGFYRFWWHSVGPLFHLFTAAFVLFAFECVYGLLLGSSLTKDAGGAKNCIPRYVAAFRNDSGMGVADDYLYQCQASNAASLAAAAAEGSTAANVRAGLDPELSSAGEEEEDVDAPVQDEQEEVQHHGSVFSHAHNHLSSGVGPNMTSSTKRGQKQQPPVLSSLTKATEAPKKAPVPAIPTSATRKTAPKDSKAGNSTKDGLHYIPSLPSDLTRDRPSIIERVLCALIEAPDAATYFARPVPILSRVIPFGKIDSFFTTRMNGLSQNQRALDTLKLLFGSLLVFLLGNYVRMQPWDRDNAKIFYVWVFVATAAAGGPLLAAPFEYLLGFAVHGFRTEGAFTFFQRISSTFNSGSAAIEGTSAPFGSAAHLKKDDNWKKSASAGAADNDASLLGAASPRAGGFGLMASSAPLNLSSKSAALFNGAANGSPTRGPVGALVSFAGIAFSLLLLVLCVFSGLAMVWQEYHMGNSPLFDREAVSTGKFIQENAHPKAVVMHSNHHTQPSCSLAGRPSLVSYFGWVSNHGYNAGPRLQDRDYALGNLVKDSDPRAYQILRRWGVRYVVGEHIQRHHRPKLQAWEEAVKKARGNNVTPRKASDAAGLTNLPDEWKGFDPDLYLDNQVKRIFKDGRFEVFEVLGY